MLETARAFRRGATTPTRLVGELLERIEQDSLNAFIGVDHEGALSQAAYAEGLLSARPDECILAGIPLAVKDNICTRGLETTCASNMLAGFVPPYDAHVITRLKQAGAVIIGKTNLDEFAMGSATTSGNRGPARNPWNPAKSAGGSSGGSAAAVAAGLCLGALGTDTGGSIRQPAAFCGLTGLKPTYGTVSRYGLVAFASSLDQIGPLARSAREAALLFDAIKGHDPRDATSVARDYPPTPLDALDLRGVRIGVPPEMFGEGLCPEVERAVREGVALLGELGAEIVEVRLPHVHAAVAVYYILATAEASSNLARYDGVRYGLRAANPQDVCDMYLKTRSQGFKEEVKRRIMLGTYVLAHGYYERYYRKASQVRALIAEDFRQAFAACDLLAGPTAPLTAFELDAMADDPLAMYRLDIDTIPASLSGVPALSLPCGFSEDGLPIGLQLMAPAFCEARLLGAAITFQEHTRFHEVWP